MDCFSFGVALGGLIVAVISTVLMYKQRTASLQESLYAAQINACRTLMETLVPIYSKAWQLAVRGALVDTHETDKLRDEYWRCAETVTVLASILPELVITSQMEFTKAFKEVLKGSAGNKEAAALLDAICKIQGAIRKSLHVEPLAEETAKTVQDLGGGYYDENVIPRDSSPR